MHILEDDCVLSKEFIGFTDHLERKKLKYDIVVTEMYANPEIHNKLSTRCESLNIKNRIEVLSIYTGCTSSCLIRRDSIDNIYDALTSYIKSEGNLLPLDNFLVRLSKDKTMKIGCSLPFVTSVEIEESCKSTIQECTNTTREILLSRKYCTLLRRDLSLVENPDNYYSELLKITAELAKQEDFENNEGKTLIGQLISFTDSKSILEYKFDSRLKDELDNPQFPKE